MVVADGIHQGVTKELVYVPAKLFSIILEKSW